MTLIGKNNSEIYLKGNSQASTLNPPQDKLLFLKEIIAYLFFITLISFVLFFLVTNIKKRKKNFDNLFFNSKNPDNLLSKFIGEASIALIKIFNGEELIPGSIASDSRLTNEEKLIDLDAVNSVSTSRNEEALINPIDQKYIEKQAKKISELCFIDIKSIKIFLPYLITGDESNLKDFKYAEKPLKQNIVNSIKFFKNFDKKNLVNNYFVIDSHSFDSKSDEYKAFSDSIKKLISSEISEIKYVFLQSFHWTSGFVCLEGEKIIFKNCNSSGSSIPIQSQKNQILKIVESCVDDKTYSLEFKNSDGSVQQKDGNFCGYCSIFNFEKEFFKDLGVNSSEYEIFKKQMYFSEFFLENFICLDGSMNKIFFSDKQLDKNLKGNLQALKKNFDERKNDIKRFTKDSKSEKQEKITKLTNEITPLNSYSKYLEFLSTAKKDCILSYYISYLKDVVNFDKNDSGLKIVEKIEKDIHNFFKESIIDNNELKDCALKIFTFIKNLNNKINNKQEIDTKKEIDSFVALLIEYKNLKSQKINIFLDELVKITTDIKIQTSQKEISSSFKKINDLTSEDEFLALIHNSSEKNIIDVSADLKKLLNRKYLNTDFSSFLSDTSLDEILNPEKKI